MIDIHSHILPGVDDGAKNMEQSLRMLRMAWEQGIEAMIVTPHYHKKWPGPEPEVIQKKTEELQKQAHGQGIPIQLYTGNELFYHHGLIEKLKAREVCTLAGSVYVLVEFYPGEEFEYITDGLSELQAYGYRPILAHVERYVCLMNDSERIWELVSRGCLIQMNAKSVEGKSNWKTRHQVWKLLKNEMVHFIATDTHDEKERPPRIAVAEGYVKKKCGDEYCNQIFNENAKQILGSRE